MSLETSSMMGISKAMELDTYPKLFLHNYKKWGSKKVALRSKEFGFWREYTWEDCYHLVKAVSLGLISLGLQPGDKVFVAGDNTPEWHFAQLATMSANCTVVGSPPDSISSELKYLIDYCDASFVVAEDQEQVDKVLNVKDELPKVKRVIYWDPEGMRGYDDPILMTFEELMDLGKKYEQTHPGIFEENIAQGKPDDILAMIYTSGTTCRPKAVMITHCGSLNTGRTLLSRFPWPELCDCVTNAPPYHVFAYCISTVLNMLHGLILNYPETADTFLQDQREIGATFVGYFPKQWDDVIRQIQVRVNEAGFLKRFFYRLFLPIGYKTVDLRIKGRKVNFFWNALSALADLLVFKPVRDKLGLSRAEVLTTGGTISSAEAFRLLHALGLEVRNWYVGTEAGSIAMWTNDTSLRSVGRPSHQTEIRISGEGEALIRGPSVLFSGYYKDTEKSAEVFHGGWYHTGDAVSISEDGEVFVIDRISNLAELATGARYAPSYTEAELRFSPYVDEALIIGGEGRDYLAAAIAIDFDTVAKWAEKRRITYTTFVDLSQKPEVAELIRKDIERVNKILPESSRVRKYVMLHKEFDPDEGEITRTRKVRRDFLAQRYAELIDAIYKDKSEVPVEATVKYRDGRVATVSTNLKIRTVSGGAS